MFSTILAVAMVLASCGWVVGPTKPLTLEVTLATVDGRQLDNNLELVRLYQSTNEAETDSANMVLVGEVQAPSPTGFDENNQPYVVAFPNLDQSGMDEGVAYYFFAAVTDEIFGESDVSAPSDATYVDRTPPLRPGAPRGTE